MNEMIYMKLNKQTSKMEGKRAFKIINVDSCFENK